MWRRGTPCSHCEGRRETSPEKAETLLSDCLSGFRSRKRDHAVYRMNAVAAIRHPAMILQEHKTPRR